MQVLARLRTVTAGSLVFAGGTSLSKGYGLIQRFSEDLNFKVASGDRMGRAERREFRIAVMSALVASPGWTVGKPIAKNKSRFFTCDLTYAQSVPHSPALRPAIRLEVTIASPTLETQARDIGSFVSTALGGEREVSGLHCVSPVETAADKLGALTWRVLSRARSDDEDAPTMFRHLALATVVTASPDFQGLARDRVRHDLSTRGSIAQDAEGRLADRLAELLKTLHNDPIYSALWLPW